ncbi:vps9 domain protein [Rutstroemia sp. NJR-2017a BBW]|nr:vps9 domain protein [Rutstroemia sp. NJR-2017a BBW]
MHFTLPDFMASSDRKSDASRPRPLQLSRSFSKLEPSSPDRLSRPSRANTIQNGAIPAVPIMDKTTEGENKRPGAQPNISEKNEDEGGHEATTEGSGKLPADFDELPIELVSLADSFIDSLSAKVHPTPPSIEKLSALFQDFYAVAANHINTHISALSSRQHRDSSPVPSVSSLSSTASKFRAKAASMNKEQPKPLERGSSEQQMLTSEEINDRKRARKALEHKRGVLEEAIERRVCEGVYDRIWRHRSTQDEAQDEKLRSKTAALSVVGIGLTDLGVDLGLESTEDASAIAKREMEVREWLEEARTELIAMNEEKYPLGKLNHLKAAHKSIVDTLSHFHPSSSADEIMPMLIYTLITSRPEGMDVISNLYFIQRFRCETKIDGEAAYCLTNLEAAISFLETVDLASLRADEVLSGPPKLSSRPGTPRADKPELLTVEVPPTGLSAPVVVSTTPSSSISKGTASSVVSLRPKAAGADRRLSDLFQPPAAFGAAGDAIFDTADQGFKSIGNSLGDSYKFLLGKLKERDTAGQSKDIIVPKTLDDARKLVSTPPPEDDASASGDSTPHSPGGKTTTNEPTSETKAEGRSRSDSAPKLDERVLSFIGGRKMTRERSTDSNRSGGSASKRVAFAQEDASEKGTPSPQAASSNPAIVESMRNLGNSLNPMNRIAGMGMMRGFGRVTTPTPTTPTPAKNTVPDGGVVDLTSVSGVIARVVAFPDLASVLPQKETPKETPKVAPPIKRFMEIQNPGDLKINEVLELLRDYRRLAGALKDLGAV